MSAGAVDHAALGRALAALVRADVRVTLASAPGDRVAVHASSLCDAGEGVYLSGDTLAEALERACAAMKVTP